MSILIKDMEMPKRCYDCQFCEIDEGLYCMATNDEHSIDRMTWIRRRPKWCPLVKVRPVESIEDVMEKRCYVEVGT